jgi:hypothetical protein
MQALERAYLQTKHPVRTLNLCSMLSSFVSERSPVISHIANSALGVATDVAGVTDGKQTYSLGCVLEVQRPFITQPFGSILHV